MSSSFFPVTPRINKFLSKRKSRRFKLKIFSTLLTVGFALFILFLVGTAIAFGIFARDLPSPNKLSESSFQQSTKIYDRNGVLLYNIYGDQNRTLVTLDKIPKDLKNATVAIEDKNFYKHKGFDPLEIVRAARDAIFEHRITGASTLTQQLVKNALLTPERTITRKIKEVILAIQIERRYTKDQILQIYLNEIPYGGTAWGAEAASNQYFAKHVWELSLVESAILAGLPQAPTIYSPFGNDPKAYIDRTKDVLRRMREDGYVTSKEEKKADDELPGVKFASFGQGIKAPHFSIYVKTLLEEKYGTKLVQEGGLSVTTTLDYNLQEMAQNAVRDEVAKEKNLKVSNGAAVIENTRTGEILAWVGSKDYFAKDIPGQFDIVSQAVRQPGSALKPFNYLTGFEKGYTPATVFLDVKTDFGTGYSPGNYDDKEHGPLPVRIALGNSYNIPAVKMLGVNGVTDMIDTLKKFGITTLNDPSRYGLSLTLGGGAIKLSELANAYAILGNQGREVSPQVILKVTTPDGRVLEDFKPVGKPKEVVQPEYAYLINNILSDPSAKFAAYGTLWANRLNFRSDIAVKTGTSEQKVDNWTFGYSPSYVIGTWVGNNNNSPMDSRLSSGITGAAPIYRIISEKLFAGKKVEDWSKPDGVVSAAVDSVTGMKPGKFTTSTKTEVFTKWQVPSQEDDMHKQVKICTPTGLLSNPSCDSAGLSQTKDYLAMYDPYTKLFQPTFFVCSPSPCPPTSVDPNDYSGGAGANLKVKITSPSSGSTQGTSFVVTASANGPNQITGIQYYLDGTLKSPANYNQSQFTYTAVAVGTHTIKVVVFDSSGDKDQDSMSVVVKNSAGGPMPPIHGFP